MPIPTPSATFPVVGKPEEGASLEAAKVVGSRSRVFVAGASVPVVVAVVVFVDSVMLKNPDTKPLGPSGFIQRKKTLEYSRSKP